jgi:hypothetical protein
VWRALTLNGKPVLGRAAPLREGMCDNPDCFLLENTQPKEFIRNDG